MFKTCFKHVENYRLKQLTVSLELPSAYFLELYKSNLRSFHVHSNRSEKPIKMLHIKMLKVKKPTFIERMFIGNL